MQLTLFSLFHYIFFIFQILIYLQFRKHFKLKFWQNIIFFILFFISFLRLWPIRFYVYDNFTSFYLSTQGFYFFYISLCGFVVMALVGGTFLELFFKFFKRFKKPKFLTEKNVFLFSLILGFAVFSYAYYSANFYFKVKHTEIKTTLLKDNIKKLRIVQLTDIHLDHSTGARTLKRIIKKIEAQKPDIIVITGDLVDTDLIYKRSEDAKLLKNMKSTYGNFAVLGNHEAYVGYDLSLDFHKKAGLKLLEGESYETAGLVISGVSDEMFSPTDIFATDEAILLTKEKEKYKNTFVLLLKHRPDVSPKAQGLYDLALTGHTHHGQIWPMHYLVQKEYPNYKRGLKVPQHKIGVHASLIYNSAGTGFWGFPIRVFTPAEITVIDIIQENK